MKMKKILCSILAIAMILGTMGLVASAKSTELAPGSYDENWTLLKDWDTLVAEGLVTYGDRDYGPDYAKWLVDVDDSIEYLVIDGSTVEVLWNTFSGNANAPVTHIKGVKMTDGVKTITYKAFNYATNLKTVELADTVDTVLAKAFFGTGLESATMYADINYIDERYLTDMATFRDSKIKTLVIEDGVTSIPAAMFRDCKDLKSVVIPASVTSIGDRAFYDCLSLESVTILGSDVEIGSQVFDKNNVGTAYGNCDLTINAADAALAQEIESKHGGNGAQNTTIQQPAAVVDGVAYTDLVTAFQNVNENSIVYLMSDVTVSDNWDCRYKGTRFSVPVTIDGNGKTMTFNGTVDDGGNHDAVFRLGKGGTVKNLTVDMSGVATDNKYRVISSGSGNLTVDNCNFIGHSSAQNNRAVIFGEGAGTAISEVNATISNSEFSNWRYGVIDNENRQDVKSVSVTNSEFANASVNVSAKENASFNGNIMDNSWVTITSYSPTNELSVVANDNTLEEDSLFAPNINRINAANVEAQKDFNEPTATINGVTYYTLDSAIAAIGDGQTLEILAGEYPCFDIPKRAMNIKVVGETDTNGNNLVTILAAADSNDGSWWHSFAGEARNLIFKTEQGKASTKGEDGMPAFDTLSMYCNCAGTPANAKFYDCDFLGQGIAFGGDVDFDGCDFDGLGYASTAFSYCVPTGIENYIIDVEDCTFKNYTFCTIQLAEGDGKATLNVKDSDVDGAWEMGAMKDINITNSKINSDINIYGTTTVNVDDASVISEDSKVVALYDGVATVNGIQGEGASNVGNVYYGVSAAETFMADTLTVEFEPVAQEAVEDEYSDLYNINIKGNKEFINRLSSADLTFDFAHTDAVNADMAYEIIEVDPVSVTTDIDFADRYMFSFDGVTAPDESGASITIGQVKISGYGTYSLTVKGGEKNIVNTAEAIDNIVEHFYVGGAAAGDKELNLGNGTGEHTITVPTRTLTVNIDFPNAVKDNDITYQDMTVVISGEDIEDITYHLGKGTDACDVAMVDDNYVIEVANKLTLNTSYDIAVTGAGYRTARYTVRMTDDKTVNFWNNVKDADAYMEVSKQGNKAAAKLNYLAGDIVKDNKINTYDLSAVVSYFGETGLSATNNKDYAKYDLNRDGFIDSKDVAIVLVSWGN